MRIKDSFSMVWRVRWGNPYSSPPDGAARVLLEIRVCGSREMPPEIKNFPFPPGYTIAVQYYSSTPPRRWSEEAKQKLRRSRLANRLAKSAPLFAGELFNREIKSNPNYYGA